MTTPYTYLIGWTAHNMFYYGRRTGRGCDPSDLWVSYFTSSIHVAAFRAKHGEPDIIKIRHTFRSLDSCRRWEDCVLRRIKAATNPKFLNKRNGDKSNLFNTNGTAHAKLASSGKRIGPVSITDPRWITGEIVGICRGMVRSTDTKDKLSMVRKDTAIALIISTGEKKRIHLSDPRWVTGEIVGHRKGNAYTAQQSDHVAKRIAAKMKSNPTTSADTKAKMSTTRKGKRAAYDAAGTFIALVDITDDRWGITIFQKSHNFAEGERVELSRAY